MSKSFVSTTHPLPPLAEKSHLSPDRMISPRPTPFPVPHPKPIFHSFPQTPKRSYQRVLILFLLMALSLLVIAIQLMAQSTSDTERPENEVRIKDLVKIDGTDENQLKGLGLVMGLAGTGDSPKSISSQMLSTVLTKMDGIRVDANDIKSKNVAVVIVTTRIGPFQETGTWIDATVSSIGDAKSLKGGTLLTTPLRGPRAMDSTTYAIAQGPLFLGNDTLPTTALLLRGARVEKNIPQHFIKLVPLSAGISQNTPEENSPPPTLEESARLQAQHLLNFFFQTPSRPPPLSPSQQPTTLSSQDNPFHEYPSLNSLNDSATNSLGTSEVQSRGEQPENRNNPSEKKPKTRWIKVIDFFLKEPDFNMAVAIDGVINSRLTYLGAASLGRIAEALNGGVVRLYLQQMSDDDIVHLLARILELTVPIIPSNQHEATVVLNERTKSYVITGQVLVTAARARAGQSVLDIPGSLPKNSTQGKSIQAVPLKKVIQALEQNGVPTDDIFNMIQDLNASGAILGKVIVH